MFEDAYSVCIVNAYTKFIVELCSVRNKKKNWKILNELNIMQ